MLNSGHMETFTLCGRSCHLIKGFARTTHVVGQAPSHPGLTKAKRKSGSWTKKIEGAGIV